MSTAKMCKITENSFYFKQAYIRTIFIFIGISGCFSVLFGAWFAHAGVNLSNEVQSRLANALQYQFFHTLALLAIAVWLQVISEKNKVVNTAKALYFSASFFIVGILCFSGSLYMKTFFDLAAIGKLAPVGGMSFALGWLCISWAGINNTALNSSVDKDRW
jgi:uncharacterized membrane protein YgdD (TMEM256/DUF423 family)